MAKATDSNTTTRRRFLGAAALASAVLVPAISSRAIAASVPTGTTADWIGLEAELVAVLKPVDEADDRIKDAEQAMEIWKQHNPVYGSQNGESHYANRYTAMMKSLDFVALRKERNELWAAANVVAKRIAMTPVHTLADAAAKSRITLHEGSNGLIRHRLLIDLQNI